MEGSEKQIELVDLEATAAFAKRLAGALVQGSNIFLYGDLGAGKTTLVRYMLEALGHTGITKSPTYTLVETYKLGALTLHHFDLYRLSDAAELEFIGIRDYVDSDAVCLVEWPQKGLGYLPEPDLEINLAVSGTGRVATLTADTDKGQTILKKLGKL